MTSVEATGNTVEEAKRKALEQLGVSDESRVEFVVLDEGKKSLLGILVSPARVRATLIPSTESQPLTEMETVPPEVARQVAEYVDKLLRQLRLNVQAVLRGTHGRYVEIEMVGRDVPVLVGKNGEVINALQFLLNLIVPKATGYENVRLVLDGAGWRRRRTERLRNQVIAIANEVKKRREEAVLPPMPPHERRIVHQALKDDPEVYTYSEGEEPNRYVVISPREPA
ncbi:MAG: RNA-binding cell elongation regulator Jag/EloR [Armatimonadota bacterium]